MSDAWSQIRRSLRHLDAESLRNLAAECLERAGTKRLWTVESGSYSDHQIHAVFTSEDGAKNFADRLKDRWDTPFLGSVAINMFATDPRPVFRVSMAENGDSRVSELEPYEFSDWGVTSFHPKRFWGDPKVPEGVVVMRTSVHADDEAHAVKIVNERRTQLIASGEWPDV